MCVDGSTRCGQPGMQSFPGSWSAAGAPPPPTRPLAGCRCGREPPTSGAGPSLRARQLCGVESGWAQAGCGLRCFHATDVALLAGWAEGTDGWMDGLKGRTDRWMDGRPPEWQSKVGTARHWLVHSIQERQSTHDGMSTAISHSRTVTEQLEPQILILPSPKPDQTAPRLL